LQRLAACARELEFAEEEFLFREGNPADAIYLVRTGERKEARPPFDGRAGFSGGGGSRTGFRPSTIGGANLAYVWLYTLPVKEV
jgi:hypothetical protein